VSERNESEEDRERGTDTAADPAENPAGDIGGQGGEGSRQAEVTPEISEEGEHGQTSVPAPDDDAEKDEDTRREE
jgi:hypothetical protein